MPISTVTQTDSFKGTHQIRYFFTFRLKTEAYLTSETSCSVRN